MVTEQFTGCSQEYNQAGNKLDWRLTRHVRRWVRKDPAKLEEAKEIILAIEDAHGLRDDSELAQTPLVKSLLGVTYRVLNEVGDLSGGMVNAALENLQARLKNDELFVDSSWFPAGNR